tara:strand:- start:24 stop:848 length:825 start_codon:yes stop_codon:yes gene_type:complete
MKKRHNKKRNTAFLFEVLVRELTKSFVSKDSERSTKIKRMFKESFGEESVLKRELNCYKALRDKSGLDKYTAEKLVFETKKVYNSLDQDEIFFEQSKLIKKINVDLGSGVYKNFVPNYKSYATISQIFGDKTPVKSRVLLESEIIDNLITEDKKQDEMKTIDSLVVRTFTENFNKKYAGLLESQRKLLEHYIVSFLDNGVDFKIFLAEQLSTIKNDIKQSLKLDEVKNDREMVEGTKKTLSMVENFDVSSFDKKDLIKVLKLQNLVNEYAKDAD